MIEPANDPPMVLRPEQPSEGPSVPVVRKPGPGFWEAILWSLLFLAVQLFAAIVTVTVVFIGFVLASKDPKTFTDEQLDGLKHASETLPENTRPPVPSEFGIALASGMLAAQILSLLLIVIVLPRRIGPGWKRQIGVRWPRWKHVLLVLLILPGFVVVPELIQAPVQWATGMKPGPETIALKGIFSHFPWVLTALAVAIGPGVVEEFWCRGLLGRGLCARYGIFVGVLLTSLLFALMHMNPVQLLAYMSMGAYLHFVYFATRSIWASILLHAANNGLAILLALTLPAEKINNEPTPIIVSLVACALVLFGSIALWTSRVKVQLFPVEEGVLGWEPEYPGISAPPPDANTTLTHGTISPVALIFTLISFCAMIYFGYRFVI